MEQIEAKAILQGLDIDFGSNCEKAVDKFNSALRRYYSRMVNTGITDVERPFQKGGIVTLSSMEGEKIYKLNGIFVELKQGCDNACYKEIPWCGDKTHCYDLRLFQQPYSSELSLGGYYVDEETVHVNVGKKVKNGWFNYARGPKFIDSLDDLIPIANLEHEILQMELMRFYHESNQDYEASNYFEQRSFNSMNHAKKQINNRIPYTIGSGYTK